MQNILFQKKKVYKSVKVITKFTIIMKLWNYYEIYIHKFKMEYTSSRNKTFKNLKKKQFV